MYLFIFLANLPFLMSSEMVEMKIVNEVSNYGWHAGPDNSKRLEPKVQPAKFSGPEHLRSLKDKCFNLQREDYKYELCLFNNVTQHERTLRWNPYSGILGVWDGWKIVNNTYKAMLMKHGDDCGQHNRLVEVFFICGRRHNLTGVSEPLRCHYKLIFETPFVCHEDSMLVYPTLNSTFRKEWDGIEQDFYDGITTQKGYDFFLSDMFYRAGLISAAPLQEEKLKQFEGFDSLDTCNAKYIELLEENKKLKERLSEV